MKSSGTRVVVVVVTYNGMHWLDQCLGSLRNSTWPVDVVVVDNGSSDGSRAYVQQAFPEVLLMPSDINLGFGQANNKGMRWALDQGADHVFLLNQDAWVLPDTLERLVKAADDQPEYAIISPLHLNGGGDALDANFARWIAPERCPGLQEDLALLQHGDRVYDIRFVNAAAWLVTGHCLRTVGGFDPSFFHYTEDNNYVDRVHYHGLKVGVLPTAVIHHDRSQRPPANVALERRTYRARKLRQHHANPALDLDPAVERRRLWKELLLAVVTLRKADALVARDHLKTLADAVPPSVLKNRERAKQRGPTFL